MKENEENKTPLGPFIQLDFKTASGGGIRVKKEAIEAAKVRVAEEKDTTDNSMTIEPAAKSSSSSSLLKTIDSNAPNSRVIFSDFQTGSGKRLTVSKDLVDAEAQKHETKNELDSDINLLNNSNNPTLPKNIVFSGFQTGSGKKLTVSKDLLDVEAQKHAKNDEPEPDLPKNITFSGFQTGSGRKLTVSKDLLESEAQKHASSLNEDESIKTSIQTTGFQTGSGRILTISKDLLEAEAQKHAKLAKEDVEEEIHYKPPVKQELIQKQQSAPSNVTTMIRKPASTSNLKDAKPFKRPQFVAKKPQVEVKEPPVKEPSPEPNLNDLFDLPVQRPVVTKESSSLSSTLTSSISSSSSTNSNKFDNFHLFDSIPPRVSYLTVKEIRIEAVKQSSGSDVYVVAPVLDLFSLDVEYPKINVCPDSPIINNRKTSLESIESKRSRALSNLQKRLQTKKQQTLSVSERSKGGSLFEVKQQQKQSQKRTTNCSSRIRLQNLKLNKYFDFSAVAPDVNDNLDEVKFALKEYRHLLDEFNLNGFIKTLDNGVLIPDENGKIGINEFFDCFLDSTGVDSKLVDKTWFRNHFKWIVWKLSSYDLKFGPIFKQERALDPINIIAQVKYRYDVEIGNAKRSCIKRVTEKDDTLMNKLVILFVSQVFMKTANMIFIELSDGWYSIRALCDCHLTDHFKSNKVKVGDKLAVFSAELVGCPNDGCTPLEAPEQMHLKLSINSTRRVRWYAKLGFTRPQRPLYAPLYSLKPNSAVGAIDALVERIYPLLYMEKKEDGSKVYRNQKQEEQLSYYQMECSNSNRESLEDDNEAKKPTDKSNKRRDVSQIVKLRLVDVRRKKDEKISCMLTIWQNAADLVEKINEGERIRFFNLFVSVHKSIFQESSTIFLSTSRLTFFKVISTNQLNIERSFITRTCYDYSDLYDGRIKCCYSEVDFCGVVIKHTSTNPYHNLVFLTNLDLNRPLIVCICFSKNTEYYGYGELFNKPNNQPIACLNVKYARKKELGRYPCLFATETSIFTQRPTLQNRTIKFLADPFNRLVDTVRSLESKNELSALMSSLESELKSAEENPNPRNYNNPSGNAFAAGRNNQDAKSKYDILNALSGGENSNKLSELPPLVTKSGARHPGLTTSRASLGVGRHNMPLIGQTAANNAANKTETRTYQMKRRSDISHDLLRARSELVVNNGNNNNEDDADDDDSILLNQDFDAMCKSASSTTKRSKLD